MKRYTKVFLYFSAFVYINIASAQTFNDGPMELQVRITEVRVDYHPTSNQSDDFNLSGSIGGAIAGIVNVNIPSLEVDEITAKVWARANPDLLSNGWQGGGCMPGDLPMSAGGPEVYLVDPSVQNIFNTNFPGPQVPQFFDLKLQAWEDEKSGDFDQLPSSLLIVTNDCQTNDGYSRCTYDGTNTCCLSASLFGCLFSERDDNFCDADPFQVNLDYRAAGPPCRWNNHGFIAGNCPSNNFYQVRVESFYRFTSGLDCSSAIDLGTLTSGVTLNHFNSNECYSNNLPNSPGNDVFYKFTINSPIGVNVSVCGTSTTFDTYVYLLDNNCNVYDSNDDGCGTQSLIQKSLCRTGVYYVVVDGKNANSTGTFRLTIDENPSFTFAASTVKTNPSCNGYNDGAAEVNVTGGQPQFTYLWSNGSTDTLNTGLIAGTYTVTVTDANGCTLQTSATLVDPAPITVSVTTTDLSCSGANDGSATAAVSGGTFPYNYAWNSTPPQVGSTAVLLPAGTYNVTVADFNGCTATGTGTVSATNPIIITVIDSSDISCFGANDGAITISVSGGQSPYSYNWSNGAPSSPSVSGLSPGPIDVVVIDNTGTCNEKMSFFTFEPAPLVSVVNATRNVSCNGWSDGAIDLGVTGGTLPYTYQWSAGAISEDLLSTSAGPFSVTVTDANGCTAISNGALNEPTAITSTASVTDAGCYGSNAGAVDLSVAGGTPGYSFFWSNDETTEDLTSLPAGDYQVVITDANGCVHVDNITVTEFTELNVQPSVTNPSCIGKEDGKISLTVTGASPLSYEWSDGSTGAELDDLKAGSYTVTVTDANNCQQISTLVIEEPTANCGGSILDVAVPNAFSPNGDDINEQFDIYRADDVSKVTVKIYDRWGAKVYENPDQQHGPNQGWDGTYRGKEAQVGAYVYVMEIEYSTPNTTDRPTQKTGTVTLVR